MSKENICKCGIHLAEAFSPTAVVYGQFPDNSAGQYATSSAPGIGHILANFAGHLGTSKFGMFGSECYVLYGQQYGTAEYCTRQYTQWPDSQARGRDLDSGRVGNASDVKPRLESMKIQCVQPGKNSVPVKNHGDSTCYCNSGFGGQNSGGPKKITWASVASYPPKDLTHPSKPPKPQLARATAKKPGVLAPPTIIPSSKPQLQPQTQTFQSFISKKLNK